jgi:ribosomal protein S18 acetylase RimI-like enzyme
MERIKTIEEKEALETIELWKSSFFQLIDKADFIETEQKEEFKKKILINIPDMESFETISKKFLNPDVFNNFWVLLVDDKIAGCIAVSKKDEKTAELSRLAVGSEFRRKGYAKMLTDYCEKYCKEHGFEKIVLTTSNTTPEAINLYKKLNYILESEKSMDKDKNMKNSKLIIYDFYKNL